MLDIKSAENALKQGYLDAIRNRLNTIDGFISMVGKTTNDVYGNEIIVPFQFNNEYITLKQKLANIYGYIKLSDKAIRVSQNNANAFVNLVNSEIESLLKETEEHIVNAVYGKDFKSKYYLENYNYDILKLSGLKELFDTKQETLYGVNRNKYNLNPIVKTIKEINTFEIEQIIDENNNEVNFLICSPNTKRKIEEFMSNHHQNINRKQLPDSLYYMEFNKNVIIQTYKYMSNNEIWLVNSNDFKLHQLCDWLWVEDDEGRLLKIEKDKPIYEATLIKYANLICHNINKQIKIIFN